MRNSIMGLLMSLTGEAGGGVQCCCTGCLSLRSEVRGGLRIVGLMSGVDDSVGCVGGCCGCFVE